MTSNPRQPSIQRKPVPSGMLQTSKNTAPAYNHSESNRLSVADNAQSILKAGTAYSEDFVRYSSSFSHDPAMDARDSRSGPLSTQNQQIPITAPPPYTESKRSTLTKQQPAPQPAAQRASPPLSNDTREAARPGKLHKENVDSGNRRSSLQLPKVGAQQQGLQLRQVSPGPDPRGRSASAQPPVTTRPSNSQTRVTSTPEPNRGSSAGSPSPTRGRIRRSWLPGGRSRSNSEDIRGNGSKSYAWVMTEDTHADYNPSFLKNGEKVPELWNENGSILVHLYPKGSGVGPSFKVPEHTISSSIVLNELIQAERETSGYGRNRARSFDGRASLTAEDAARLRSPHNSPPIPDAFGDLRLYLPPPRPDRPSTPPKGSDPELDRLISIRNLFAFLTGQPLVGTRSRPTVFQAFLEIADLLQEYGFLGLDGASFGEHVNICFGFYLERLKLADCRTSREKTVEALILGERMRSEYLYTEAYAHAAGKYSAIMDLKLPLYSQVSPLTRQRLERAHIDLINRQHNVNEHLEQFEFPALFAGIASSTSISELRQVRFKVWRNSFNKMRQLVLGFYKSEFGNWPPKARSKKNPFAESGLNRIVIKILYKDMCDLYDLLVDRTRLTTRVMDQVPQISGSTNDATTVALHTLLSEFDRSKPPVLPPVPFDLPQLPSMTAVLETYNSLSAKDQLRFDKKLKDHELELILNKAYNYDAIARGAESSFLEEFRSLELREAKGKTALDLVDQRIGYWVFLYVILQSLPMLVVDAPGLKHTGDTEYFLCEPPMGNPPWVDDKSVRKMWYGVAGGGGIVELSTDTVLFSVEGTYQRSHCWLAAKKWEGASSAAASPPLEQPAVSPLQPPPAIFQDNEAFLGGPPTLRSPGTLSPPPGLAQPAIPPRHLSPASRHASRSSIALGLEPVPMDSSNGSFAHRSSTFAAPTPPLNHLGSRSVSAGDLAGMNRAPGRQETRSKLATTSGATFDDILGSNAKKNATKKKSKFF